MSGIRCWNVYEVRRTATQEKMFIALYSREVYEFGQSVTKWTGFYINSEPQCMAADAGCDVEIHRHSHEFLKYDSTINVGSTIEHYAGELDRRLGVIENGTCERVLQAVHECGLLDRRVEVLVFGAARAVRARL